MTGGGVSIMVGRFALHLSTERGLQLERVAGRTLRLGVLFAIRRRRHA